MFLKHRNSIAWLLLLIAAVALVLGYVMCTITDTSSTNTADTEETKSYDESTTTSTAVTTTTVTTIIVPTTPASGTTYDGESTTQISPDSNNEQLEPKEYRAQRVIGIILCVLSIAISFVAIFVLKQNNAVAGPDGISMIIAFLSIVYYSVFTKEGVLSVSNGNVLTILVMILQCFVILCSIREIIGWIRARLKLSWCLIYRISRHCTKPHIALVLSAVWIILAIIGIVYCYVDYLKSEIVNWVTILSSIFMTILGFSCLWKYGADLNHFKIQLNNYQQGLPINVGNGAFSETEAQLLDVQAQHEEAVRTAVTSERFKVELISNVSHDLRTPLTAILGYSELLQKETLSPEGQEQLKRLNTKAGYMNDLVESLFEMTKVSSGVIPSKQEKIDLVCLLEQTIGLFDDQLVSSGLTVRRNYVADTISVITDGARMYQVFANLLGNAIKYALSGTRIYFEVKETENHYVVRITNTASYEMDFKPDEIMQRFARGDKSRSTKGSGLGLAIAQTYTESVGGNFYVSIDGDQFSAVVELPKIERNL